jgi:hypothetical protein
LDAGELPDLRPTEYRADAVVVLAVADTPVLAVVVEVQLRRDHDKRWSWPVYLATLRARLRCPTVLLVVCVDTATAGWCAAPIELGHPGCRLSPLVVGPDRVPVVTDAGQAVDAPEPAVLSAMAHAAGPDRDEVLDALFGALSAVDPDRRDLYADVLLAVLPLAARRYLEALMATGTYEWQSDYSHRLIAKGQVEDEARAVLAVLDARGIDVPADARARITECTDVDQLDTWIRRAVTVGSVQELFD